MCEEQEMKSRVNRKEEDRNVASMMHESAAAPVVQLFIICQGHSAGELRESMQPILTSPSCADTS